MNNPRRSAGILASWKLLGACCRLQTGMPSTEHTGVSRKPYLIMLSMTSSSGLWNPWSCSSRSQRICSAMVSSHPGSRSRSSFEAALRLMYKGAVSAGQRFGQNRCRCRPVRWGGIRHRLFIVDIEQPSDLIIAALTNTGDFQKLFPVSEAAEAVALVDDRLCERLADIRECAELLKRRCVQIQRIADGRCGCGSLRGGGRCC